MTLDERYFVSFACTFLFFLCFTAGCTSLFLNDALAQINKDTVNTSFLSKEIIIPSFSPQVGSSTNNQKITFDANVDASEWKNAKQYTFTSGNIDLGKLYLQYNPKDDALEAAFVIPNSAGGSNNNDIIIHFLFDTISANNNIIDNRSLNPSNDHRIDISKNIQQARYFIGNGTNGWNVEENSIQGNNNITMKMNEPFDKINIITSSDAQKWTGEFKIYFIEPALDQQQQSNQQNITIPIKKIAIVQENYVSTKKVAASIPASSNISLIDPSTWATISLQGKNLSITTSTNSSSNLSTISQQKNQTTLSNLSTVQKQQPLLPKTNKTVLSNTTSTSISSSNLLPLAKTTSNTGSGVSTTSSPSTSMSTSDHTTFSSSQKPPQNLDPSIIVALITTIGGVIGTITAAFISNKNKNKS